MLVYPVLRTKDLKPFMKYVGEVVQSTMKLDIASKELFTLDKMSAFKKSISTALGVDGISDDQIVIVRVCDASGCIMSYQHCCKDHMGSKNSLLAARESPFTTRHESSAPCGHL